MRRRLSLRQAIACELGRGGANTRCRCRGTRAGARRCDPVKPTRWCFAKLDPADPHYIPPQHRRISDRSAVKVLSSAIKRLEKKGSYAAAETLRRVRTLVGYVVRDERVKREKQREARAAFALDLV